MKNYQKKALWEKRISLQEKSKKSVLEWCQENKINRKSFYRWRLLLKEQKAEERSFIKIEEKNIADKLTIKIKDITIHLEDNFNKKILKNCIKILREI